MGGTADLLVTSPVTWSWLLNLYLHLGIFICKPKVRGTFLSTSQSLKIEKMTHIKSLNTLSYNTVKYKPSTELY